MSIQGVSSNTTVHATTSRNPPTTGVSRFVKDRAAQVLGPMGGGPTGQNLPGKYTKGAGAVDVRSDDFQAAGRKHAKKHANERIDWDNPGKALNNLAQIDGNGKTKYDAVRCGAATLLAGSVLQGPETFQAGLGKVLDRAMAVEGKYADLEGGQNHYEDVSSAIDVISKYQERDPKKLTNGQMAELQDAVYTVANADQQLNPEGTAFEPETRGVEGLATGTMKQYSTLMWGGESPKMDGKPLQIQFLEGAKVGHFVLGDNQGVAFNPWPDKDGSAYTRSVDGVGAKITNTTPTQEGYVKGANLWLTPGWLGERN